MKPIFDGSTRPMLYPMLDSRCGCKHTHTLVHRCIVSKADMKIKIEWEDCFFFSFPACTMGLISPFYWSPWSLPCAATCLSFFLCCFLTPWQTSLSFSQPTGDFALSPAFFLFRSFSLKPQESLLYLPTYSPFHLPSMLPALLPCALFTFCSLLWPCFNQAYFAAEGPQGHWRFGWVESQRQKQGG